MTYWWKYAPLMETGVHLDKRVGAQEIYVLDLIEESPVAIVQKRVVAHFVVMINKSGFMECSQLTLREEFSIEDFYGHLANWDGDLLSVLQDTKNMAILYESGFGISTYGFGERQPIPPGEEDEAMDRRSELLRLGRKHLDSFFPDQEGENPIVVM